MYAWHKFLEKLKNEIGSEIVTKWISTLRIIKFDACNIYLEVSDAFQFEWIEEHLLARAEEEFLNNNGQPIKIHLQLKDKEGVKKLTPEKKLSPSFSLEFKPDELDNHHSFSSFYVSGNNDLCYKFLFNLSCSEEIEEKSRIPLASFNPILIHGPSGSGKTHLLMACAKAFLKNGQNAFFIRSQTFTSHVVNAFRLSSLYQFRNTYRKVNILLVDDIHLIAGKSATQEEFFHTFNTLHSQGSQIIITSNVPPPQLKDMEERLISRFEWGISLPLNKAHPEGMRLILDTKEKAYSISFDEKTKDFLLENCTSAKEIEEAIQTIILRADHSSDHKHPSLDMVKGWISDLISQRKKNQLNPILIVETIAKHFGLFSNDILGKSQTRECSLPRQIAMYLCRERLKISYQKIGEMFGGRDHSTVMTSVKSIERLKLEKDKEIYYNLLEIEKKLPS
jgi:chromosomal replication initiator protein